MDRKTYHIVQLLFKYYRETLGVSEKAELEAWLTEDERNRELLKSYEHFKICTFMERPMWRRGMIVFSRKSKHNERRGFTGCVGLHGDVWRLV